MDTEASYLHADPTLNRRCLKFIRKFELEEGFTCNPLRITEKSEGWYDRVVMACDKYLVDQSSASMVELVEACKGLAYATQYGMVQGVPQYEVSSQGELDRINLLFGNIPVTSLILFDRRYAPPRKVSAVVEYVVDSDEQSVLRNVRGYQPSLFDGM